ncbi:hypothetical protein KPL42_01580 [Clostridium gasigenes]|uniref:hypothetical protein n=1 Tax=Clostridium gasigenes TaxID=94869 RepID=UPI001C0B9969|nr:hypothetical protein [Clostridium gasigenes]MBU3087175.1 hypothetical protein [Clostridium gasigenes]
MGENKDKNKNDYYFPICTGVGLTFGVIFHQLAIGLCLGVAIGLALDNKKKQ